MFSWISSLMILNFWKLWNSLKFLSLKLWWFWTSPLNNIHVFYSNCHLPAEISFLPNLSSHSPCRFRQVLFLDADMSGVCCKAHSLCWILGACGESERRVRRGHECEWGGSQRAWMLPHSSESAVKAARAMLILRSRLGRQCLSCKLCWLHAVPSRQR